MVSSRCSPLDVRPTYCRLPSRLTKVRQVAEISPRITACVCLLCAVPALIAAFPPLHDYPFHVARFDILARYEASAFLQSVYNPPNFFLPNVGTDIVAVALAAIAPPHAAGQMIVALTVILQVSGVCALHYALWGRFSAWPLVAVLLAYNFILLYGFLNYIAGVGLALWAAAIRCLVLRRPLCVRAVTGPMMALGVYFTHLAAFALYAILLGVLLLTELVREARRAGKWPDLRQLAVDGVSLLLPLCLYFAYARTAQTTEGHPFRFWLSGKANAALTPFCFGDPWLDLVHLGTWAFLLVGVAALARMRLHPSFWPLLGALALVFIAAPLSAHYGAFIDTRIPIFACLAALALTDIEVRKAQMARLVSGLIIGAAALRTAAVAFSWHASQPQIKELVGALRTLPYGSVLFAASTDPAPSILNFWHENWAPPIWQAASYASLGRDVFVPAIWAHPAQQPITVRAQFLPAYLKQQNGPTAVSTPQELRRAAAHFSSLAKGERGYLLVLGDPAGPLASADLKQVARGRRFAIVALP